MNSQGEQERAELYFVSNRPGGLGLNDIWVSQRTSIDALGAIAKSGCDYQHCNQRFCSERDL